MAVNLNKFWHNWSEMKASKGIMDRSIIDAFVGAVEDPDTQGNNLNGTTGSSPQPIDAGTESNEKTIPFANIGGSKYSLVPDTDENRKRIILNASGQVDPSSPVIPVGKNIGTGFILMGRAGSGIESQPVPITRTKEGGMQINYPQSVSNPELLSQLQRSGSENIQSVIDVESMNELIKLYGQDSFEIR